MFRFISLSFCYGKVWESGLIGRWLRSYDFCKEIHRKLTLAAGDSFIYEEDNKEKKIISYLKLEGEDNIYTAMAKTVGLPIAILIEHIIISNKKFRGINLPFDRDIYEPVLKKLHKLGVVFNDREISI